MRLHDYGTRGRFVHAPAFHADDAVLDHVAQPHAVLAADLVELGDQRHPVHLFPVDCHGDPLLEGELDVFSFIRRLFGRYAHLEHAFELRLVKRILEVESLMAHVPQVVVAAVRIVLLERHGDAPGVEVGHFFLAAGYVPDAPRRYHFETGGIGLDAHLETDLVVALARCPVGDSRAAFLERDLREAPGYHRTGRRGAKQVVAFVHRAGLDQRPDAFFDEFLLEIGNYQLGRSGRQCLFLHAGPVAHLADVAADRDHFAIVIFLEPGHDYRGIETAGIRQCYLLFHVITPC